MPPPKQPPHLSVVGQTDGDDVGASLDNPPPADRPSPPRSSGGKNKSSTRRTGEIFPNSPVIAVGVQGKNCCYLDYSGQIQLVDNHTADKISFLFGGRTDVLAKIAPKVNQQGITTGFRQDKMREIMQCACFEIGPIEVEQRVRETGCWSDDAGGMIIHCGDRILTRGDQGEDAWLSPGLIGEHVYPAKPKAPRPARCSGDEARDAVLELHQILQTWHWSRGDIDARLMLGWVLAGLVGGALKWRPMGWITGDAGTGKSTLQELIHAACGGDTGMIVASDASEAGIRQLLMQSTRPIWLDEAEAEDDNRKLEAVVKLARQAASGGQVLRGGADHKGATFRVRSAMMFSSIKHLGLKDQDLQRIVLLKLRALDVSTPPPKIDPSHWHGVGAKLRRRLWDRWVEWPETLHHWRAALADAGHNARGQDQYGTLLAMADLALSDDDPSADFSAEIADQLAAEILGASVDMASDHERCMTHLLTQPLDVHRSGERYTVGEWLVTAANLQEAVPNVLPAAAKKSLERVGISISPPGPKAMVEVANQHDGLNALFKDTSWAGGVHRQALERIEGWHVPARNQRTWAYARVRISAFPLASLKLDGLPTNQD